MTNIIETEIFEKGVIYTIKIVRPGMTCPICGEMADFRYLHIPNGKSCVKKED